MWLNPIAISYCSINHKSCSLIAMDFVKIVRNCNLIDLSVLLRSVVDWETYVSSSRLKKISFWTNYNFSSSAEIKLCSLYVLHLMLKLVKFVLLGSKRKFIFPQKLISLKKFMEYWEIWIQNCKRYKKKETLIQYFS